MSLKEESRSDSVSNSSTTIDRRREMGGVNPIFGHHGVGEASLHLAISFRHDAQNVAFLTSMSSTAGDEYMTHL